MKLLRKGCQCAKLQNSLESKCLKQEIDFEGLCHGPETLSSCTDGRNDYQTIDPLQTFRFMVGQGHCPMISKYGPSLFKAVGPVDPSFLVVKNSHFIRNIHLKVSLLTPQYRKYMLVVNTII